jgi:cytochrome c-type biogenesis protein
MILSLLEWLSRNLEATPVLAITAAFGWGILSVILSPCHLASIPLVIGFIIEQGRITLEKAFRLSLVFAVGILITIAAVGAITAGMGRILGDIGKWGNYLVAVIFFIIGLFFGIHQSVLERCGSTKYCP